MTRLEEAAEAIERAGTALDTAHRILKDEKLDGEAARVKRLRMDVGNVRRASLGWPKLKDTIAQMRAAVRSLGS